MPSILLVDDQVNMRQSMALLLQQDGHAVREAPSAPAALEMLGAGSTDVVISDVRMHGDADGLALLRSIKGQDADAEVILITAFGTIDDAVQAMKAGAYDYLTKPVDPERLLITVRRAAERRALSREVRELRAEIRGAEEIVAVSPSMIAVVATISQLARTDSAVLIRGESGTGKELLARALHAQSDRRRGRFVPINCGAIPESLLESELFGYRRGAFTGAASDKKGLVEEAHGGVLFLDEVGEMPPAMQVRLLRFLQDGEVRRVGDTVSRRVDVRLVAATHRDLEEEVAAQRFRQDFYYRVNVVGVRVPPLRERREDVAVLAEVFLRRLATRHRRSVRGISPAAMSLLLKYDWPGNVRELENVIERAVNLMSGELLTEDDLPAAVTVATPAPARAAALPDERQRLVDVLEQCRWNQSRAASTLGISRTTLWRKMREHRIET